MATQNYIVISAFNEGHIARRFKDSKFILIRGSEVSQTFNTIKGLSDTWKKNQIKWSKLDGEPVPERKSALKTELRGRVITPESPSVLPASETTGGDEIVPAGSGDSTDDTTEPQGQVMAEPPQVETKPVTQKRTAKK